MQRLNRSVRRLLVAVVLLGPTATTAQEALPIDAFAGAWTLAGDPGEIQAEGVTLEAADLDVVIQPDGDGFRIGWTPVRLAEAGDSPAVLPFRQVEFERTAPNVFRAADAESPLESGILTWARIEGATLTIYDMHIATKGGFEIRHDARTVTGEEMVHEFLWIGSEGPERSFMARLKRAAG